MIKMFSKNKNLFSLLLFVISAFIFPLISSAQVVVPQIDGLGTADLKVVVGTIIQIFLGLLGLIAVIIVLYAGFIWMTSGGNEEKISKAKKILSAGIIGLLIIMASYAIVAFILQTVQDATNNNGGGGSNTVCVANECTGCNQRCNSDGSGHIYDSSCTTSCGSSGGADFYVTNYSPRGSDVSLCSMIQVVFNSDLESDSVPENVTSACSTSGCPNFKLYKCGTSACSGNYNSLTNLAIDASQFTVDTNVVQFRLGSDYDSETWYAVVLPDGGIKNVDGQSLLTVHNWEFRTGNLTDNIPPTVSLVFPNNSSTDVCLSSYIKAEFSEDMDILSLRQSGAFSLYEDLGNPPTTLATLTNIEFTSQAYNRKLIIHPQSNYDLNEDYYPLLNGDIIKDTCGNLLDGNADQSSQGSPVDDYPPNGPSDDASVGWKFETGETINCKPEITSALTPSPTYYDDLMPLTIRGNYLLGDNSQAGYGSPVLDFGNNIAVIENNANLCLDSTSHWPNSLCNIPSAPWADDEITVQVPADGGDKVGTVSGNVTVKVQTNQGIASGDFILSSPYISSVFPTQGGHGQYISVSGHNFGEEQSLNKIYFRNIDFNSLVEANLPCAESSWSDNNIIISVNPDLEVGHWYIQIKKVSGTGDNWSNIGEFYVDEEDPGPGLCPLVGNTTFNVGDHFSLNGVRLGNNSAFIDRAVILGNDYSPKRALNPIWSGDDGGGQSTDVDAEIPFMGAGTNIGVRVMTKAGEADDQKFSNYVNLNIESDSSTDFRIVSLNPDSAPVGAYVTISGSGFGNTVGNKKVWFKIGTDNWTVGDDNFPEQCSTAVWSDDQVVIKVPDTFSSYSLPFNSEIKIVDLDTNGEIVNETNSVSLIVNTGSPAPAICSINPSIGTQGASLEVAGEYFQNPVTNFYFNSLFDEDDNFISGDSADFTINSDKSMLVTVPSTQTGLVVLKDNTNYGNTWNFEYLEPSVEDENYWDFYGWHFITCRDCERPRVQRSVCSAGSSSPSPAPGSVDVPEDTKTITVNFEYPSGDSLTIDNNTLNDNNIKLYQCSNGDNYGSCDTLLNIEDIVSTADTLSFSAVNNLIRDYWYKVELSTDIRDDEGSRLISNNTDGDAYEWYFHINQEGGQCEAEYLNISPNNYSLVYEANKNVDYHSYLTDAGCYVCDDSSYVYEWGKDDPNELVGLETPASTISTTFVNLNSAWDIGSLGIRATSTDTTDEGQKISAETSLTITANCGLYNDIVNVSTRQDKCLASSFDCCWDSFHGTCLNPGNNICSQPFVKEVDCISGDSLASPSPVNNNQNVVQNAHIYMKFAKSNAPVDMDENTYDAGLEIYDCTDNDGNFNEAFCGTNLYSSLGFSKSIDSDNSFVIYNHTAPFINNIWYRIAATGAIKDKYGFDLQNKEWHFKVGTGLCRPDNLEISPSNWSMVIGAEKKYSTICYDNNCNVCDNDYDYDWEVADDDVASIEEINASGSKATTTALVIGSTQIIATNNDVIDSDTNLHLTDDAFLEVTGDCSNVNTCIDSDGCCPSDCVCTTDNDCCGEHPVVKVKTCTSTYSSSPSPSPNSIDVPVDPVIYVEFGYANGDAVVMDNTTLINSNIKFYQCNNGPDNNPTCVLNNNVDNSSIIPGTDSLTFSLNDSLVAGNWYKVELSTNILDNEGLGLVSNNTNHDAYEWYFQVNSNGYQCQPDTISITPADAVVPFLAVAGQSKVYGATLWESDGCYQCSADAYSFNWSESGDSENIVDIDSDSHKTTTTIGIADTWDSEQNTDVATITASTSDGSNSIVGNTSLTINKENRSPLNILSTYPEDNDTNICPNTLIQVKFNQQIDKNTLENNIVLRADGDTEVTTTTYRVYQDFSGQGVLDIYITELLKLNTNYKVALKGGESGLKSVLDTELDEDYVWTFSTANTVCKLNSVKIIDPVDDNYEFNSPGSAGAKQFEVEARTISGEPIISIANVYDWQWKWESLNEDLVTLVDNNLTTTEVTPQNNNGTTKVKVTALAIPSESVCNAYDNVIICNNSNCCWVDNQCTADLNKNFCPTSFSNYNDKFGYQGIDLSDEVEVKLFMCENPWEFSDSTITNGQANYNFKLEYCLDGDLPYLANNLNNGLIIKNFNSVPQEGEDTLLREYIFKYRSNSNSLSRRNLKNINLTNAQLQDSSLSKIRVANIADNRLTFNLLSKIFKGFIFSVLDSKVLAANNTEFPSDVISNDIIGLRIYQNQTHRSPLDWYHSSGVVTFKGSPKATKIDGYSGLKDGRTVYVNTANKPNGSNNIYTDISLISYNQDASPATINIFNQLVNNWTFNINQNAETKDKIRADVRRWEDLRTMESKLDNYANHNKYCAYISDPVDGSCPTGYYHFDIDGDGNLDAFNEENGEEAECYQVSSTVSCGSDADCQNHDMGFDKCVGVYPELNEGTYAQGISISTWPSWTATLANQIKSSLPVDPVNKFSHCEDPYDEQTCWNVLENTFICPVDSQVYYYQASNNYNIDRRALSFDLYSLFNMNSDDAYNWQGFNSASKTFNNLHINNIDVCQGSIPAVCGDGSVTTGVEECDPGSTDENDRIITYCAGYYNEVEMGCRYDCQWPLAPENCLSCGDGIISSEYGEECESGQTKELCADSWNPNVATCDGNCHWQLPSTDYYCAYCGNGICESDYAENDPNNEHYCYADCGDCGNGVLDGNEECDDHNTSSGDGCNNQCKVENGWTCSGVPSVCNTSCGDDIIAGNEECEVNDVIECTTENGYNGGHHCNVNNCTWEEECTPNGICGDHVVDGNETCEPGDVGPQCLRADGYYGNRVCNSDCFWYDNTVDDDIWCPTNESCGDEVVNGFEDCEPGDISEETCSITGGYEGHYSCNAVGNTNECRWDTANCIATEFCGDGIINGDSGLEKCDDGDSNNTNVCDNSCVWTCEDDGCGHPSGITFGSAIKFGSEESNDITFTNIQGSLNTTINLPPARVSGNLNLHIEATKQGDPMEIGIVFVSDRSGSMVNKVDILKTSIKNALDLLHSKAPSVKVALISYGTNAYVDSDFVDINNNLDNLIGIVESYSADMNDTHHKDALDKVITLFNNSSINFDKKFVIFMTDGDYNGNNQCGIADAGVLSSVGVEIFSVGLTNDSGLITYLNGISSSGCTCYDSGTDGNNCQGASGTGTDSTIDCRNNNGVFEECDSGGDSNDCVSNQWVDSNKKRNYHTSDYSDASSLNAIYESIIQTVAAGGFVNFAGQHTNFSLEQDSNNDKHYYGDITLATKCDEGSLLCELDHINSLALEMSLGAEYTYDITLSDFVYEFCPWSNSDWSIAQYNNGTYTCP